jgi:SAM-dependent methyltransferase
MPKMNSDEQMHAYSEAVRSGLYAKRSGLVGKYDSVRLYWEDEMTRHFLYPHLKNLVDRTLDSMRRLRIMDIGCGSADGFELLAGIRHRDADLRSTQVELLTSNVLGNYKGVDFNEDLLNQARQIYQKNPKMVFEQADFCEGLPLGKDEKPYDLYFSSFGTFSHHNQDETAVQLLSEIASSTDDYCLIVCDWLGRYSYEWQTLWTNDLSEIKNMDYVISYIYEKEEREERRDQLQHLNLRLMSRQEAEDIIQQASKKAGVEIRPLTFFDRSVFTGRHMDTGDYNPHAQPLRTAVNSLHEVNLRTEMSSLFIDYVPKEGFDFINDYFENLQMCWNKLIEFTDQLMEFYDDSNSVLAETSFPIPATYPEPLREAMVKMKRVVEGVGWLVYGLPRENIIEPQLGYSLRHMIGKLQKGMGCAHGLCAILEVDKSRKK